MATADRGAADPAGEQAADTGGLLARTVTGPNISDEELSPDAGRFGAHRDPADSAVIRVCGWGRLIPTALWINRCPLIERRTLTSWRETKSSGTSDWHGRNPSASTAAGFAGQFIRSSARRDAVRFSNGSLRAEECRALMTEMMKIFGCRPTQAARLGMGPAYGNAHARTCGDKPDVMGI